MNQELELVEVEMPLMVPDGHRRAHPNLAALCRRWASLKLCVSFAAKHRVWSWKRLADKVGIIQSKPTSDRVSLTSS